MPDRSVIAGRTVAELPVPYVPSCKEICEECQADVWISLQVRQIAPTSTPAICTACAQDVAKRTLDEEGEVCFIQPGGQDHSRN